MSENEKSLALPNQEGTVKLPNEFLGGASFIRYRMDSDRDLFINDVTGEEKTELLVRISGVSFERLHMDENSQLLCVSRDSETSKDGIVCACCPNINNSPFMDADETQERYVRACAAANIPNPPAWNGKSRCSFRMSLKWIEEFEKNADGTYTWITQPGICYLSCGKSSVAAMTFRGGVGYLSKIQSKGYKDIKYVVTKIVINKRKNEKFNKNYPYENFELEGSYEDITKKCVNAKEMAPAKEALAGVNTSAVSPGQGQRQELPKKPPVQRQNVIEGQVATPPAAPTQPAAAPVTPPAQAPVSNLLANKLKMKQIFSGLNAETQGIVLGVLSVTAIDQIKDSDIVMALETVEMAKKETEGQPAAPAANTGVKKPW